MKDFIIGLIFSSVITLAAYKKKSLSLSGAVGAIVLGTGLYSFGGVYLSAIMISFFISSSLLTKLGGDLKKEPEDINEKGGKRDIFQVAANGLLGLIFSFLYFKTKDQVYLTVYAVSFAASNSDTWASELGVLSPSQPVSILTFRKVEKGVSGAVSLLGTFAALSGAVFIGLVYFGGYIFKFGFDESLVTNAAVVVLAGFSSSIIDSLLGAALQVKYKCIKCGKITEKRYHHGEKTTRVSGVKWINNDLVNFLSALIACLVAIGLFYALKL